MSTRRTCVSAPDPLLPFGPEGKPGRHGIATATGVTITPRRVDIVQVMSGDEAAAAAVGTALGISLPPPGKADITAEGLVLWVQPSHWLVIRDRRREGGLAAVLAGAPSVDQSHGKAVLRVAGPHASDTLAKGCRVDLHPRAFGPRSAVTTTVDHVTVNIVQIDTMPTYDIVVPATFAENFLEWLIVSAAEYGCEVLPAV
jgi:heterotetrameric sarcosine oxidase gamma subunit